MRNIIFVAFFPLIFLSCEPVTRPDEQTVIGTDTVEADRTRRSVRGVHVITQYPVEAGGITLSPLVDSPEFADGMLEMNTPLNNANVSGNKVKFDYEIKNFRLGHPTDTSACTKCSNSAKGQHIHLILNNAPYLAKYQTGFTETLEPGHYVALSFLSRSYHESVKTRDAYDIRQFTVGNAAPEDIDLTKPYLFYSRPKDEYVGEEAKKVLLDFYLVNTDLSEDGHKVRATINGNEFILGLWQPYIMEGLPMGEVTIKLELIDSDNNLVDTKFNPSERTIVLKEGPTAIN